jgi:poly-gamma-glutamate capsule biosynthesis protein CapA/YwtB (metallophosphatase superfamily)
MATDARQPMGQGGADGGNEMAAQEERAGVRLTRRALLVATAGAAGAALASCAPAAVRTSASPTPTPFALGRLATLYADATVPRALAAAMAGRIAGQAGVPKARLVAELAADTDLVLTFGKLPAGYTAAPVGGSAWAAITHLRVPLDGVTGEQARSMLSGAITDWRQVGAPYGLPVRVYALAGLPAPAGVTLASEAQSVPTPEALLQQVRTQPGSLALAPVELADWTVRNLGIDGVYPAQGRGDPTHAPFAPLMLWLGVAQPLVKRGLDGVALAAGMTPALATSTATFDMVVSGDIILGRGVNAKMVAYNDYLYPYRKVRDEFMSADWRVANLECTVSDLAQQPTDPYTFTFVTAKRAVDGLVYAGIQTVTVANNHADNGGIPAFMDMLQTLRANKIAYCGGGGNLAEARQATIHTVKGTRVALLGYNDIPPGGPYAGDGAPGIAPIDVATLPRDIAAARAQADLVIPYFHWGIEYTEAPTHYQQQVAHTAIDAGADMVLGSHPHWAQSIESYKGRLIVYSLANFIFDQDWSRATLEGFMLHLYWRGKTLAGIRFVPTLIEDRCQPRIMTPAEAVGVFNRMWSGTDLTAHGQYTPGPY